MYILFLSQNVYVFITSSLSLINVLCTFSPMMVMRSSCSDRAGLSKSNSFRVARRQLACARDCAVAVAAYWVY